MKVLQIFVSVLFHMSTVCSFHAADTGPWVLGMSPFPRHMPKSRLELDRTLAESEDKVWMIVSSVTMTGPHHFAESDSELSSKVQEFFSVLGSGHWVLLIIGIGSVFALDVYVIQQLPETLHIHLCLLLFWFTICIGCSTEILIEQGPNFSVEWSIGCFVEFLFSMHNAVIYMAIMWIFEVPRRLTNKVMLITSCFALLCRILQVLGPAASMYRSGVMPYLLGSCLIFGGFQQLFAGNDHSVTQLTVVRLAKACLGNRLGMFYDEEGEAVFLLEGKQKCVTLLGLVIMCTLTVDCLFAPDIVLTKLEKVTNPYSNITSSAVALFMVRALFFVVRGLFSSQKWEHISLSVTLIFFGFELILASLYSICIKTSALRIVLIIAIGCLLSYAAKLKPHLTFILKTFEELTARGHRLVPRRQKFAGTLLL